MKIKEILENLSPEEIENENLEHLKENEEIFEEFKDAYFKKCCSLCGNKLDKFIPDEPCFHWFLLPNGIKKKHFKEYLNKHVGSFLLESYFRWLANLEAPLKNINDLGEEKNSAKLKEITIRFKNIEWSLNYGITDLKGHLNSENANFPHFHIQMIVDEQPFLRFNDFHIPFSKPDLSNLNMLKEEGDLINFSHGNGEGISAITNPEYLKELDKVMTVAKNDKTAAFNTSSFFQMPVGKTIPGVKLNLIFKESQETGVPSRHLIKKYYPDVKIVTEINPGEGVPELKRRNKR